MITQMRPQGWSKSQLLNPVLLLLISLCAAIWLPGEAQSSNVYFLLVSRSKTASPAQTDKNEAAGKAFAEAEKLRNQGKAQSARESIAHYEEAIALYRAAADQKAVGIALTGLGRAFDALGEKKKAIDIYNQALPIHKAAKNLSGEGDTLNHIALAHDYLGDRKKALEYLALALPIVREAADQRLEGLTLNNTGLVYDNLGDKQKALDFYNRALPLHKAAGNKRAEATTLNNIGQTFGSLGEKQKALEYLKQSLALRMELGITSEIAGTLNNIGVVYESIGELQTALDYHAKALPEWRTAGDLNGEAITFHNTASIYSSIGEYQKALDLYSQALSRLRSLGNRPGEANTLNNIGRTYRALGENQKALECYSQALSIHRSVGNRSSEASTLTNLGVVYNALGNREKALEFYDQALALRRAVGDRNGEALTLGNIGLFYSLHNEPAKAIEIYDRALLLHKSIGNIRGAATMFYNSGIAHGRLGNYQKAVEHLNQALSISRSVSDRPLEASVLCGIARIEEAQGNLPASRSNIDAALQIIELLRSKVVSQELRSSYFASVQDYYALGIDVLMHLGKQSKSPELTAAALELSERARARNLLEILTEAGADIRQGIDPRLLERERSLQMLLNAKAERQTRLLSGKHSDEQAAAAAAELESITSSYGEVQARIRATSPRYAALTQPQPLTAKEIQQLLDDDTLLLEYSLGNRCSYLWAVSQSSITSYELPGSAELEAQARSFYDLTRSDAAADQVSQAAARLSDLLLAPVSDLPRAKRLVIVADGALQYLPFAALRIPETRRNPDTGPQSSGQLAPSAGRNVQPSAGATWVPLIVEHEVVSLPSASVLALLRREGGDHKPATRSIAVLADPVFSGDDSRVKLRSLSAKLGDSTADAPVSDTLSALQRSAEESGMTGLNFARLIGTRREAAGIMASAPATDRKQALDFDASRATVTSAELAEYRLVHFATHGLLNSTHPELSGIVLSLVDEHGNPQDGFLRLHEIFNLKLSAEMIVLSACQTALGKEIRGEGLTGLTRGFMYAGARRVVASLWKIDDKATAELMKRFYQKMLGREHLSPPAALRAAQLQMCKQKQWQAPYYWAAFTLQGDWR
jgi:CHAT domain-containing protein/Tfp pilus assembly protein PilF